MMKLRYQTPLMLLKALTLLLLMLSTPAGAFEIFAKGSASKNSLSEDKYSINVSATMGFSFSLLPFVQLEARYTNATQLQNKLEIETDASTFTLTDMKTQTSIYSLGMDVSFTGEKAIFQPFIFVGAGYIETERSYYYQTTALPTAVFQKEPRQTGISGTIGAGIRLRIARAISFEIEAFSYGLDVKKPDWGKNLQGTVGIRLYL